MTDKALPTEAHNATAALISYAVLAIFALTVAGVFALIGYKVSVDPVMLTILGAVITAVTAAMTGVLGFWMGSSSGAKTSNAALAQLAGAGAPPPAAPGSGTAPEILAPADVPAAPPWGDPAPQPPSSGA